MRKGPGSVYDKWNISVVICNTYSLAVKCNQVMVATATLPRGTLTISSVASFLLAATSIKEILIGTTHSEISYQSKQISGGVLKQFFDEGKVFIFFSMKFLIFQNLVNNFFLI